MGGGGWRWLGRTLLIVGTNIIKCLKPPRLFAWVGQASASASALGDVQALYFPLICGQYFYEPTLTSSTDLRLHLALPATKNWQYEEHSPTKICFKLPDDKLWQLVLYLSLFHNATYDGLTGYLFSVYSVGVLKCKWSQLILKNPNSGSSPKGVETEGTWSERSSVQRNGEAGHRAEQCGLTHRRKFGNFKKMGFLNTADKFVDGQNNQSAKN